MEPAIGQGLWKGSECNVKRTALQELVCHPAVIWTNSPARTPAACTAGCRRGYLDAGRRSTVGSPININQLINTLLQQPLYSYLEIVRITGITSTPSDRWTVINSTSLGVFQTIVCLCDLNELRLCIRVSSRHIWVVLKFRVIIRNY